jgi:hypothetical protein
MPNMISVNTWLSVSSVLSVCYCLDRYYVLKRDTSGAVLAANAHRL